MGNVEPLMWVGKYRCMKWATKVFLLAAHFCFCHFSCMSLLRLVAAAICETCSSALLGRWQEPLAMRSFRQIWCKGAACLQLPSGWPLGGSGRCGKSSGISLPVCCSCFCLPSSLPAFCRAGCWCAGIADR